MEFDLDEGRPEQDAAGLVRKEVAMLPSQAGNTPLGRDPTKNLIKTEGVVFELSEELLEKIISRMPFPYLFKAPLLSKSWNLKFTLDCDHVSGKSALNPLQKEIISMSSNWKSYSPVFVSKRQIWGFDRVSCQWKSVFTLSYLPIKGTRSWSPVNAPTSAGALICVPYDSDEKSMLDGSLFITNVITRHWRKIRTPPKLQSVRNPCTYPPDHVRLLAGDSDTYKVVALYIVQIFPSDGLHPDNEVHYHAETHIYDSSLRSWSVDFSGDLGKVGHFFDNSVYFRGKLYCMCDGVKKRHPWQLWIHNVDSDRAWIRIPWTFRQSTVVDGGILLCGEKILVVVWHKEPFGHLELFQNERFRHTIQYLMPVPKYTFKNVIRIFELDPESLQLRRISEGPPKIMMGIGTNIYPWKIRYTSDADFIYFGKNDPSVPMMTYNVHSKEWGWLPTPSPSLGPMYGVSITMQGSAFAPGLNPYASV